MPTNGNYCCFQYISANNTLYFKLPLIDDNPWPKQAAKIWIVQEFTPNAAANRLMTPDYNFLHVFAYFSKTLPPACFLFWRERRLLRQWRF